MLALLPVAWLVLARPLAAAWLARGGPPAEGRRGEEHAQSAGRHVLAGRVRIRSPTVGAQANTV